MNTSANTPVTTDDLLCLDPSLRRHDRRHIASDEIPMHEPADYDIIANRPAVAFKEQLFWKACRLLNFGNTWVHEVWRAQMNHISTVDDMVQLVSCDFREHFYKFYGQLYYQTVPLAAGER